MFKGENEFSVGDRVKFKKSNLETGMIDAKEDDVFIIEHFQDKAKTLALLEGKYFAIYNVEHLEHVKEQTMNNTEGQEIKWEGSQIEWEVGQVVWDVCVGKGKVIEVTKGDYPIVVQFALDEVMAYTLQGKMYDDYNRTLFFSEPTISADTLPPKKSFTPTLKNGDEVVVRTVSGSISAFIVEEECEEYIKFKDVDSLLYKKRIASINKVGEQIKVYGVQ